MRTFVNLFLTRHEPVRSFAEHAKSAIGAMLGLLLIGALARIIELPLLLGPLGATSVLVFGYPGSALAQPVNVLSSYLVTTIIGVAAAKLLPHEWWVVAPAVGLSLFLMQTLRITHPPAGAIPILTLTLPGDSTLLFITLLVGCAGMLGLALLFHRIPPRRRYPAEHPGLPVQETVPPE